MSGGEGVKTCSKCGEVKAVEEFARLRRAKDGRAPRCKACDREYREANRERIVKTGRRAVDPLSREGFVYRLYDDAGALLYVGLTYDVTRRFFDDPNNHAETKPWWPSVAFVWVEHFSTYADAQEAERWAITHEDPAHNQQRPAPLTDTRPEPVGASEYGLSAREFVAEQAA